MKIKESAIRFGNGSIFTGKRHHDCFKAAKDANFDWKGTGQPIQGFMTDTGQFVSREFGAIVAKQAGQIKELKFHPTELFSEDLY